MKNVNQMHVFISTKYKISSVFGYKVYQFSIHISDHFVCLAEQLKRSITCFSRTSNYIEGADCVPAAPSCYISWELVMGATATKGTLSQNFLSSYPVVSLSPSRKNGNISHCTALTFDRNLGSGATEMPDKFQSDMIILITNVARSYSMTCYRYWNGAFEHRGMEYIFECSAAHFSV